MKTLFLEKRKKNEEETNNEKIASTTLYRQNMSINYPRISVVTICYLNIPSRKEFHLFQKRARSDFVLSQISRRFRPNYSIKTSLARSTYNITWISSLSMLAEYYSCPYNNYSSFLSKILGKKI